MATVNHASTRGQRRGTIRTRPHERILASYPNCHVRVLFLPTQRALESRGGTCTVSSQRLVFTSNQASEELDTLSVPLETMSVGKYMLPIFCAPYWQATMTHFTDGTSDHGQVIVRFPSGGGMSFPQTIRAAQAQWDVERHHEDILRTYQGSNVSSVR